MRLAGRGGAGPAFAPRRAMVLVRRLALVVAVFVVIGVAYRVLGVYEFRAGECRARQPRVFETTYPQRLRVMSFNIEGHASLIRSDHIEKIAETIRKYDPDIVGLNEVHRGTWQARFRDHTATLAQLTGLNIVFGRSYRFAGGDFGNAVLTKGAILSSEVHDLPGRGEPRSLLETVVAINGGRIEFYVTHTAAWAAFGRPARTSQLQCINQHVQASGHPFILAGDLNAPPDTPEMQMFLRSNALRLTGDPEEATHKLLNQRLDYVLTDPGWRIASARVIDDGPSDHRPVIVELLHP
jgi:endonuclease/exonuclease/phosphatase family metal-dependent hydrolase